MSQHDFNIANQTGASFRSDLNDALAALATNSSGAASPSTTFAYQWWADTTANRLKQRNGANSAWFVREPLDDNSLGQLEIELAASVGSNALTIALKARDGNDPSANTPVRIPFRSATVGSGAVDYIDVTAAASIVVSSGSTLGTINSTAFRFWVVAFNDAGTFRLGVINCLTTVAGAGAGRDVTAIFPLTGWGIASSTAEGGAGAADSAQTFYTGSAVTAKSYVVLGYVTYESGLATAGTYASAPTRVQVFGPDVPLPGGVIQVQLNQTGAYASGTTQLPMDDTIPQITEGDQYMTQAITPGSAANALAVESMWIGSSGVSAQFTVALFQDATANALAATAHTSADEDYQLYPLDHMMLALTSSSTTLRIRAGANGAGTTEFNGRSGGRQLGGVMGSYLKVSEVMA